MNRIRTTAITACVLTLTCLTQQQVTWGQKWVEMDYGPNMTHSFEIKNAPEKNISYKGMKVKLGQSAAMLFDEDLLRWSGGWLECDLDWRNVIYDGSHGTHPGILGQPVFVNPMKPGWNSKNDFSDPRKLPYGPLAKSQARFLGQYRHGDRILVKFQAGAAQVLESASLEAGLLTRTSEISGNDSELFTQIALADKDEIDVVEKEGVVWVSIGKFPKEVPEDVKAKKARLGADALTGLSSGLAASWSFDQLGKNVIDPVSGNKLQADGVKLTPGPKNKAMSFDGRAKVTIDQPMDLVSKDYSITGWVKTTRGGTLFSKGPKEGRWEENGKSLFVRAGKLVFDIGWVGAIQSQRRVADGKWHAVAMTYEAKNQKVTLYVDGKNEGSKSLPSKDNPEHVVRLGYTATNFAPPLVGALDDMRMFSRKLTDKEIAIIAGGVATGPTISGLAIRGLAKEDVLVDGREIRARVPAGTKRFKVQYFRGGRVENARFVDGVLATPKIESLESFTKGGPANYTETVTTQGELAKDTAAYVTDRLTLPHRNPWKSWMRIGGFDFFSDPTKAALCTWSGDVWVVSGIKDDFQMLVWKRIATGMFQPLGLKIINDEIYVGCRDQITKLVDLNGDGETDFYQTFNNDHQVTEHFHEFAMDLQTDAKGNFFYAKSARHALDSVVPHHGTLIRVSPDGSKSEIVCNGFRAANGVGIGPNGEMATSDQEGHWTPANRINLVKKDGFYGNMYSFHRGEKPTGYDPPLVWLPKNVDRSPAAQFWCSSKKWGPFYGKMLSTSYGTGKLWHVMYEEVDGKPQGGVVQLPVQFPTGIMRGRFHPVDGQLYACGLFGWSSNQTQPGGFYRVRYTGQEANLPLGLKIREDGIELTFSDPLDPESAEDSDNFSIEQWNYRWTRNYGSAHYSVDNPKRKGQDEVEVWETQLADDGKTVFIEIEDLQPVMQMQISYTLRSKTGKEFKDSIWLTINAIPE